MLRPEYDPLPGTDVPMVPAIELGDRVVVVSLAGEHLGTVTGTAVDMMGWRRAKVKLDDHRGTIDVPVTQLRLAPE